MNVLMGRKKILIIGTHLHCERIVKKQYEFFLPMIGVHVASQIDQSKYDIMIYNELSSGPYNHKSKKFYDIVFLSGLQKDFDRMRQLSYFFRKKGTLTVAGGSICTLYSEFASGFFDVVCSGGVDSVWNVMRDYESGTLKKIYHTPQHEVRDVRLDHSLLVKSKVRTYTHLIEASRGCNYTCGFCTMPAEKARHTPYSIERMRDDIRNALENTEFFSVKRWYPMIYFIDNHFTLNRKSVTELCEFVEKEKRIKGWGALISQNELADEGLMNMLRRSKCRMIYCGLESLEEEFLHANNKNQNLINAKSLLSHVDRAHRLGTMITYGYLFDPVISSVEEMMEQFRKIVRNEVLIFPCFLSFVAPLMGTKVFLETLEKRELLPNLRLRDLDGCTLSYKNIKNSHEEITEFADKIFDNLSSLVSRFYMLRKTLKFIWRYRIFDPLIAFMVYKNNMRPFSMYMLGRKDKPRNYIGGKDKLDPQYYDYPPDITTEDHRRYFAPIMVTDENGDPAGWLKKYLREGEEETGAAVEPAACHTTS